MTSRIAATRRFRPPLLRAKLSRPNLGEHVLSRPRLLAALHEHLHRPLTLLVADAGYGKTTLLAALSTTVRRPVVWYSLMPSDADPVVFGRYLLEGFRRESPRFGRDFQRLLEEARPGARDAEVLGGTLANELSLLKGPVHILVLDDFHEAAGSAPVVAMVDTLLLHLPERVRIVLSSRTQPPLGLERLRCRGELFEVHSEHLRLTRDELRQLFVEVYRRPLGEEELEALEQTTLGWPTAVHLVYESLRRSSALTLEQVLADFRASNLQLKDYLSSEVYSRLEPEPRHLLERTAALARFDADLAAALCGSRDVRPELEGLARRGLLRTFDRGPHASYECHELVRRFVRQRLEARDGLEGWRALEADTAVALVGRGETEPALRHFLLGGRAADAAALIQELAPQLLRQGRAATLLGFLSQLPPETVHENPSLTVALADAHQALGHWDEAESLYQTALERCRATGARELECRGLLGLGKVLNLRGRHEQVLGMAERGLAMAYDLGVETQARLLQMKAGAHYYLGQYQAAVQVLDQVRQLLRVGTDPDLLVPTVHNLAMTYAAQGRFHEASEEFRAALAHVRGSTSPRAPLYLSNLAFLLAYLGELGDARRAAEEGLQAAQRFSNRAQETTCQEALAQILAQSGDLDGALAALKRAEELNAELRMEVIAADLLALRGRIFCARGQYRRAVEFLNQAIERLRERPEAPGLTEFRATTAWCELRAGRVRVARDLLVPLVARADAGENDYERMRVHYWLGEALLALGDRRGAEPHLALALRLVRERGYLYFLRVQAREEPAPLLHTLARGREVEAAAGALVEAGGPVEEPLLELLESADSRAGEAAVAVLAEVGGAAAQSRLPLLAKRRRALGPALRTALRHIQERTSRGAMAAEARSAGVPRLVLFGPPLLEVDGRPAPASAWRAQRAFHLLIFLAVHPRGANKDELLERFWPGRQLAAGRRNFHPTLSYVRAVLPRASAPPILRQGETYRLNPAYPMTCDAWELERLLEEAARSRDSARRRELLERAAQLASNPFLEGLYSDWADAQQARARERIEKLLVELGGLCAKAGDFERALQHLRRAAELDEYNETSRLKVIECLVRLGNRRAAIAEYDRLKNQLAAELQVEPLPETEEAMRRLLNGQGVHGWPTHPQSIPQELQVAELVAVPTQVRLKRLSRSSPR